MKANAKKEKMVNFSKHKKDVCVTDFINGSHEKV